MSEPFWDGEISEPQLERTVVLSGRSADTAGDPMVRIASALERIAAALEQQQRAHQN